MRPTFLCPTFVFLEVQCILLVGDDLLQVDNVGVVQLPEDLDFPYSCDGKTLLLIFQSHLLQSHQLIWKQPFNNTYCSNSSTNNDKFQTNFSLRFMRFFETSVFNRIKKLLYSISFWNLYICIQQTMWSVDLWPTHLWRCLLPCTPDRRSPRQWSQWSWTGQHISPPSLL